MASTNKTQNYELSQYIGSDKPTYLGDYNADMLKIDTQMKRNADDVASVSSIANTASTTANTALQDAENAQSSANDAQTSANTANATATTALNKALKNESNINNFNLTSISDLAVTHTGNGSITPRGSAPLKIAKNSDGSLCKIYGVFRCSRFGSEDIIITSNDTGLRPESDIVISPAGFRFFVYSNGQSMNDVTFTIKTTGEIVIRIGYDAGFSYEDVYLFPFLIFVKDFGDVIPVEPNV